MYVTRKSFKSHRAGGLPTGVPEKPTLVDRRFNAQLRLFGLLLRGVVGEAC